MKKFIVRIVNEYKCAINIEKLQKLAETQRKTIYSINHRHAGWGITWWEEERQWKPDKIGEFKNLKTGLMTYKYYDSFQEMIKDEYERLLGLP